MENLHFEHANISEPLAVGGQSCDAVYARLSLHYFDDEITSRIFSEVHWVLRRGGWFFFVCPSVEDPLYGKGQELSPDMFNLDGHIRHFFSDTFARELLIDAAFTDIESESGKAKFYGEESAYIRCAARKA